MLARFNDGETTASHMVEVAADGEHLVFRAAGSEHRWALRLLGVEQLGDRVRLSPHRGEARLTVRTEDWKQFRMALHPRAVPSALAREGRLILTLAVVAATAAFVIFVGLPALSGPLARHTPPSFEAKMGRSFETQLGVGFPVCRGQAGQAALAAFGRQLTATAHSPFEIRPQAVQAPMVNAFALPGGRVQVTGRLIDLAETPDELAAVIAHEAAHVQRRHVMQAVWRSLGLGVILDALVGGGTGAGQQAVLLAGSFTNLRYSRQAEAEADLVGQQLLQAQGLSCQGMSPFFFRLAAKAEGKEAKAVKELISDHPDTLRRAEASKARGQPGRPAFDPAQWAAIKAACKGTPGPIERLRHFP